MLGKFFVSKRSYGLIRCGCRVMRSIFGEWELELGQVWWQWLAGVVTGTG